MRNNSFDVLSHDHEFQWNCITKESHTHNNQHHHNDDDDTGMYGTTTT